MQCELTSDQPHARQGTTCYPTTPAPGFVHVYVCHSYWCKMIAHSRFDLHFPEDEVGRAFLCIF